MNILEFMSNSPFLTFFLAYLMGETLVGIAKAIRGKK